MRLVVAFPRPRLSVLSKETEAERGQRWIKALTELPVRRAVLRLATGEIGTVQVTEVTDPGVQAGFDRFLSATVAGSGQSAREVEQAQAWRREEAERVAGGSVPMGHSALGQQARGLPTTSITPPTMNGTPPKRPSAARAVPQGRTLPKPQDTPKQGPGAASLPTPVAAEDGSFA